MKKKLFVLGPKGTHSHWAAVEFLSNLVQTYLPERKTVFCSGNAEALHQAKNEEGFCVVPIENSLGGLVDESVRFWLKQSADCPIQVIGEVCLPIRHHLMTRRGGCVEDITEVSSHPQAISQCFETVKQLCPDAVISKVTSTAAAARDISEGVSITAAAIASEFASVIYGLEIVHRDVHDFPQNTTRFHVVGPCLYTEVSEFGKTAVIFRVPNTPGSLLKILSAVDKRRVNMSSIHSIPLGVMGEYAFYCEFNCHRMTSLGKDLLEDMERIDENLLVLGSFPSSL